MDYSCAEPIVPRLLTGTSVVALYIFLSCCKLGQVKSAFPLYLAYFRENRWKGGNLAITYNTQKYIPFSDTAQKKPKIGGKCPLCGVFAALRL